jgi:hypothetical protein
MKIQLLIERNEQGQISISGPIADKMLCYGLLECARDAIVAFNAKAAQSQIALARPGDIPDVSKDHRSSFDAPLRRQ